MLRLITRKDDAGESHYADDTEEQLGGSWEDKHWSDDGWYWVDGADMPTGLRTMTTNMSRGWASRSPGTSLRKAGQRTKPSTTRSTRTTTARSRRQRRRAPAAPQRQDQLIRVRVIRPKAAKVFGCSICGSRWHQTSSCPVGGQKGGSKGHSKGYGNYGKGKKGSGKSKW